MDLCPFHVNRYIYLKRFDPLGNHIEQMRFGLGIIFYIHVMILYCLAHNSQSINGICHEFWIKINEIKLIIKSSAVLGQGTKNIGKADSG